MRKKSTSGGNDPQKSGRQVAYQRGNQKEGSPHYVFLYSEDDQSEDEEQHFPLKTRNPSQVPRKIEVINVQIQSEDTLQALALRYSCTISELKRINKIHKDNEIHAHRTIKVPVQPYSLLTETIGQNDESKKASELNVLDSRQLVDTTSRNNEIINLLTIPKSTSSEVEINNIILNSTVEPLSQFNNESSQFAEDTETDQLISSSDHNVTNSSNNFVNTFKCSGADWGLSWYQLLCFSLLLGFAGPIIYVLYITESSKQHNSS